MLFNLNLLDKFTEIHADSLSVIAPGLFLLASVLLRANLVLLSLRSFVSSSLSLSSFALLFSFDLDLHDFKFFCGLFVFLLVGCSVGHFLANGCLLRSLAFT